jgi:hypothetical protein
MLTTARRRPQRASGAVRELRGLAEKLDPEIAEVPVPQWFLKKVCQSGDRNRAMETKSEFAHWQTSVGDKVEAAYRRGDMLAKRHQLMAGLARVSCPRLQRSRAMRNSCTS